MVSRLYSCSVNLVLDSCQVTSGMQSNSLEYEGVKGMEFLTWIWNGVGIRVSCGWFGVCRI